MTELAQCAKTVGVSGWRSAPESDSCERVVLFIALILMGPAVGKFAEFVEIRTDELDWILIRCQCLLRTPQFTSRQPVELRLEIKSIIDAYPFKLRLYI